MIKVKKQLKHIFIDVKLSLNTKVLLDRDVSNRLKKVMRFKQGWQFAVFNAKDGLFLAEIIDSDCQEIEIIEKLKDQPKKTYKTLFLPILKKEALSNAVRQATELGIDVIQPVITEFTVENKFKYDRYEQIALGACEQSERLSLVELKPVLTLKKAIESFENKIFWACEREISVKNNNFSFDDAVLIGPEGGFSVSEKQYLSEKSNIVQKSLGSAILKADTAVVVSIVNFNDAVQ